MKRVVGPVSVIMLWVAACEGEVQQASPIVLDSAGVRIVENSVARGELTWRLGSTPRLDIGRVVGGEHDELFRVRGAIRLSTGTVVVANGGSNQLRYFGEHGEHVVNVGGFGGGPGEFGWLSAIFLMRGDSIGVDSGDPPRFQVFDAEGRFSRSMRRRRGTVQGIFSDGSVVVAELALDSIIGMEQYLRPSMRLVRLGATTGARDTIGLFLGTQALYRQDPERGFFMAANRAFLQFTRFAVANDQLVVADNAEYRVDVYGSEGDLRLSIRRTGGLTPLTDEVLESWYRSLVEDDDEAFVRRNVRNARNRPNPETVPAFQDVLVDDVGNYWVQEYAMRFSEPQRWSVFSADGVLLGTMEMPSSFRPYHIGSDFVLGQFQDELDVERVQLYDLVKPTF